VLWALVPLPREYVCEATNFAPKPMNPPPAGTGTSVHGRAFLLMAWRAETKPYRPLYVLTAEIGKPASRRRLGLGLCRTVERLRSHKPAVSCHARIAEIRRYFSPVGGRVPSGRG
jgi:hypothetical protein